MWVGHKWYLSPILWVSYCVGNGVFYLDCMNTGHSDGDIISYPFNICSYLFVWSISWDIFRCQQSRMKQAWIITIMCESVLSELDRNRQNWTVWPVYRVGRSGQQKNFKKLDFFPDRVRNQPEPAKTGRTGQNWPNRLVWTGDPRNSIFF